MKVLLADNDRARQELIRQAFAADPAIHLVATDRGEMLNDAVLRHRPDVILVDMARPDRDALESLRMLGDRIAHPTVLFVDEDDPAFMEEAIAAGVISYNVGAARLADVKPILRAAVALFRAHQATRAALLAAEARLQEKTLVEGAKRILAAERRLSEPEAHRWLQRQAMQTGRRLHEVARIVVDRHKAAAR